MSLRKYTSKRNFRSTPEPVAKKEHSLEKLEFVVQRHKATRLHYDFRLELDGVLKSWAVPKGPSMNPADKRLAMMVEDHPYSYRTFKGVIPEGNYGAGIVEIWDHGIFVPLNEQYELSGEKEILKDLKKGSIKFLLKGRKLKGLFALVKMKTSEDNAWLLIKHDDEYAVHKAYDSESLTPASSPINKALSKKQTAK
jgi:bifunctional non-homologous end joining protein LigD